MRRSKCEGCMLMELKRFADIAIVVFIVRLVISRRQARISIGLHHRVVKGRSIS